MVGVETSTSETLTPIPLVNLHRQIASLQEPISAAIAGVMSRADFIHGKAVAEFETAFAQWVGLPYCVGVGNGTDALTLMLRAAKLPEKSVIVTTPMSFIATTEAVSAAGYQIAFADIDPDTYGLSASALESVLAEQRASAILPVHLYGQSCDMLAIMELASRYQCQVFEDVAQAHGAKLNNQSVGSFGRASAYSFYPGKNLGAFGDGGAVVTADPDLAEEVRKLANHGRLSKYEHLCEGVNSRLDTLQAAILQVKLACIDQWNAQRRHWAAQYHQMLADVSEIKLPQVLLGSEPVYHLFVIQVENRDALMQALKQQGIASGIHYPIPLHRQPAYAHLNLPVGRFPNAEKLASQALSLPLFPEMLEEECLRVVQALRTFYGYSPL
ncbi:MAG: DegT/DnrJ/EryC1/StrS family aminotransferase [Cyanobacteria bacterium]|nr:DegT/DnrJ/EryC1/StrS family aminotransferase [Cyanobacteriota bacterium]